jgi:hypothetical protein
MATFGQFEHLGPINEEVGGAWKLYHYIAGTTTLKDIWSDRSKETTESQPLVADANGHMEFFADGLYRFDIYDSNDVLLYTWDNVFYGSIESTNHAEGAALSSASTLALGEDGDYFHVTGTNTIGAIQGTQPFVILTFDSSLTLTHSVTLILKNGVNHVTVAGETLLFVNDGDNVFREVDNNVPTKNATNIWSGENTFTAGVTFSGAVTFSSTATIATPTLPTHVSNKDYAEQRASDDFGFVNLGFTAAVSSNALTVSLITHSGSAPSTNDVAKIAFRSTTSTNSRPIYRNITGATTVTLSEGSSLGFIADQISRIYVIAIDNSGSVEIGLYHPLSGTNALGINESLLYSTTAEGGSGGADTAQVIYSTTARSSVAVRVVGWMDIQTGSTAGNWDATPTRIQLLGHGVYRTGDVVQRKFTSDAEADSGTGVIPVDNSIPQSGEGNEFMTLAITPQHAANLLFVAHVGVYAASTTNNNITVALFQDAVANAKAAVGAFQINSADVVTIPLVYMAQAGTASSTTFKIRAGGEGAGTTYFNSENGGTRVYGGVCFSAMTITEIFV